MTNSRQWTIGISPNEYDRIEAIFDHRFDWFRTHRHPPGYPIKRFIKHYDSNLYLFVTIRTDCSERRVWTEAILFENGCEAAVSLEGSDLKEPLKLEHDGVTYEITFKKKKLR